MFWNGQDTGGVFGAVLVSFSSLCIRSEQAGSDHQSRQEERWRPVLGLQAAMEPGAPALRSKRRWTAAFRESRTQWSQYKDFRLGASRTRSTMPSSCDIGWSGSRNVSHSGSELARLASANWNEAVASSAARQLLPRSLAITFAFGLLRISAERCWVFSQSAKCNLRWTSV